MKSKICGGLLFCAAILAVAAAIFLPPYLSRLADRRLDSALYEVRTESLDVSLTYTLSTEERLAMLIQRIEQDNQGKSISVQDIDGKTIVETISEPQSIITIYSAQPAQGELSDAQAIALCQDELDRLFALGAFPSRIQFFDPIMRAEGDQDVSAFYQLLYNRDSRQKSLSCWTLQTDYRLSDGVSKVYSTLTMDAETGLLYSVAFSALPEPVDLLSLAEVWGEYLELGAPTVLDSYSWPSSWDANNEYISIAGVDYLEVIYQTDAGEIPYYFWQKETWAAKNTLHIILSISLNPPGQPQ